ncbi:MAG: bi-domain-containing oxidoreductase [bacterium]
MKQIIQNYRTGAVELAEVPIPLCSANKILIKNVASLISIGTERSIIELGKKSLLGKAKTRPDLVKRFVDKAKKEGFIKTFKEALGRLDNPTPLGYSSAGIAVEVGNNVYKFSPGDRVACIAPGFASHAEYITVPEMLCSHIPKIVHRYDLNNFNKQENKINDNLSNNYISFEEACFGMLGIIALHGIRSAKLAFGENVVVIGLGLLGLLSIQILKAYGCKVIGMDIDPKKVNLAKMLGADNVFGVEDDLKRACDKITEGYGIDAIIITASTKSDSLINTAIDIAKFGGRIVLVGVADIHPQRNEMWHKEVEIIVSKAGGPGTFDPCYEHKGIDYPLGYVRWTENRNLEEFLRLISERKVNIDPLISHRFKIDQAETVYKNILNNQGGPYIGVVLKYSEESNKAEEQDSKLIKNLKLRTSPLESKTSQISIGVIGAGLFGKALLLPALKKIKGLRFHTISTSSSANASHTGIKYGFENYTTDYKKILDNKEIDAVVILTPHSLHCKMVIESLSSHKHVFVEKPLCVNTRELEEIIEIYNESLMTNNLILMVGYNRRFSPHIVKIREYLNNRKDPMVINYRINAGFVPSDHWVHSEEEGGSRIIGEVCHFIDMLQLLTVSNPSKVYAERISGNNKSALNSDNVVIILKFLDGSIGNIIYSASGDKAFSREQIEIFCEGKTIVLSDYRKTAYYESGKKNIFKTLNQEMGYQEELQCFFNAIKGKAISALTTKEIFLSTLTIFQINEALARNKPIMIGAMEYQNYQ